MKNLCLLLVSCVVGISLCEVSLRLFYPRYRDLAEAPFENDALRIWARTPNSRDSFVHPDTRSPHTLFHNNFSLRQHRNFREADLAGAVNIGVFGDSFTENVYVAAPYSFTEPLDYLLNLQQDRFNVLNFGVQGYGPGQSFLHYQDFIRAGDLDHVLYVYYHHNDLADIYVRGLFHLDEAGRLVRAEEIREAWWAPLVRNLHVTYLILDAIGRVSFVAEQAVSKNEHLNRRFEDRVADDTHLAMMRGLNQDDLSLEEMQITLEIFRQMIRRWKNLVEDAGGAFSIVLSPTPAPPPFLVDLLRAEGVEMIDLHACFNDVDPAHSGTPWAESSYRFKNDRHWNETGNSLAAVCLYRALEEKMGFPGLSEDGLREAVFRYYAAFGGENFLAFDSSGERALSASASPREASAEIRRKYMELDLQITESGPGAVDPAEEEIMELVRQPDKRIISSDADVYLAEDHLVFVKDNCRPTDMEALFFLHVTPVDNEDLPGDRRPYGFENMDIREVSIKINDRQCAFTGELPDYPVRLIRAGQYVPGAGELWAEEFEMERYKWIMDLMGQPDKRIISSGLDVYLAEDRLVYVKNNCRPTDVDAPFFLHVTPVDNRDLPVYRRQHGFENLDFDQRSIRISDRQCAFVEDLPDYPVRGIRTGQYVPGAGRLWEGEATDLDAGGLLKAVRSAFRRLFEEDSRDE